MSAFDKVVRAGRRAILGTTHGEGRPADLGNADNQVYFIDENGVTHGDTVWVRFVEEDGKFSELPVNNSGLPNAPGMPVLLVNRGRGLTAIIDKYSERMRKYTNNGGWIPLEQHGYTHRLGGTDTRYVEGLALEPGLVRPSSPPAMTAYIEPVWYNWNGNDDVWTGGVTPTLAAYVPGSASIIHFVIVCLDSTTNTVVIVDGADITVDSGGFFAGIAEVSYSDIEAISINAAYIPLAVVELVNGQTTITSSDITFDLRRWLTFGVDINGLTEQTTPTADADYMVIYDAGLTANRKVLLENLPGGQGNAAMLFSQTVSATIADTTDETGLLSAGVGSKILPADLLEVGSVIRVNLTGHYSTTGTPAFELAINFNGTELATTGAKSLETSGTDIGWRLWFEVVCRSVGASGTVVASGIARFNLDGEFGMVKTSAVTIDTTGTLTISALGTWGTADAANTLTCQTAVIEHLSISGLAPVGPSDLEATFTSDVQLTWTDNSGGAQTFNIERSITSAYAGFTEIADGESSPYDDTGLADDTYWYRVRGFDGTNYSDYSNVVEITVTS